jgi:hypothetical protein
MINYCAKVRNESKVKRIACIENVQSMHILMYSVYPNVSVINVNLVMAI